MVVNGVTIKLQDYLSEWGTRRQWDDFPTKVWGLVSPSEKPRTWILLNMVRQKVPSPILLHEGERKPVKFGGEPLVVESIETTEGDELLGEPLPAEHTLADLDPNPVFAPRWA